MPAGGSVQSGRGISSSESISRFLFPVVVVLVVELVLGVVEELEVGVVAEVFPAEGVDVPLVEVFAFVVAAGFLPLLSSHQVGVLTLCYTILVKPTGQLGDLSPLGTHNCSVYNFSI